LIRSGKSRALPDGSTFTRAARWFVARHIWSVVLDLDDIAFRA
jgi:hypothetical protein